MSNESATKLTQPKFAFIYNTHGQAVNLEIFIDLHTIYTICDTIQYNIQYTIQYDMIRY